ncbi:SpoIIE family protein phosphatase [Nonomuraea sp. NPDC004580]|uniref:SpoIIE family protein phosphatase n=1 Tax=Nonomuraea sp. NPDC004580 TaxID=3154552 RepID=UPI0033A846AC
MTVFVITFLLGCLSVMTVRGRQGNWPAGMPGSRSRLVAVGGTYEGGQASPSDAYVVQERMIAAARGMGGGAHAAAALTVGTVVAARPQHGGVQEEDLDECAQAAHRAVRAPGDGLASALDLVVLDRTETPRLRFLHAGGGTIWHCPKGGQARLLTTPAYGECRVGLPGPFGPQVGTVALRPGDRVAIASEGALDALGAERLKVLFAAGASPASCLDRIYDEMAAQEPKDDATVIIAEFVTA